MIFSEDLRKRSIEAIIEKRMRITEVSRKFKIGRRTLHTWLGEYKKEGKIKAKTGYQKGHSRKIKDLDEFRKFVEKNNDCSAKEMAVRWEKQMEQKVSTSTILRALRKIECTFKKKHFIIKKQMKNKETIL